MRRQVNVLAMIKGEERYLYIYDDESHATLLEVLSEQAGTAEMSLNGFDAAVLARRSREQVAEHHAAATAEELDG